MLTSACLCVAGSASAGNAELARAEKLFNQLKYKEAAEAADAAKATWGNDRATLLRILELQGICAALSNHSSRATRVFEGLLALDPSHVLAGDWPPRVTTPFFEAKAWLKEHGPLGFEAEASSAPPQVTVEHDDLGLAHKVRFHLREPQGAWQTRDVEVHGAHVSATTDAPRLDWWAELLGERDAVLFEAASAETPLLSEAKPVPAAAAPPAAVPRAAPGSAPPAAVAKPEPAESEPRFRPAAYGSLAAGAVCVGVGAFFAGRWWDERSQLVNATTSNGVVTGLTQRQAFALDSSRQSDAIAADVLLGAGVALAVTGGVLLWEGRAVLSPAPGGAVVSGVFP